jgi:hypothetical protein
MQHFFCIIALFLCFETAFLNAQDQVPIAPRPENPRQESLLEPSEQTQNMISLDIARLFGYYNLSYTRAISPLVSISAQVEVPTNFITGLVVQESGLGIRVEGRFNLMQKNFMGVYLAPVLGFNSLVYRPGSVINAIVGANDFSATTAWFLAGVVAGYQFAPFTGTPGLMFGVGGGAEVNSIFGVFNGTLPAGFSVPNSIAPGQLTLFSPRIRATIGYAW